jgi:hypothetical protein
VPTGLGRIDVVAREREIGDLTGCAVSPPVQLSVDDETHPDASADRHEGERVHGAAVTVVPLGEGGEIDVVLDDRRVPEDLP